MTPKNINLMISDLVKVKVSLIIACVVTIESCSFSKKSHNIGKIHDWLNSNDTVKIRKKENENPLPRHM